MPDGDIILFGLDEKPCVPFDAEREIFVVLPSGKLEPGPWRIRFEKSHKDILDMGRPPRT